MRVIIARIRSDLSLSEDVRDMRTHRNYGVVLWDSRRALKTSWLRMRLSWRIPILTGFNDGNALGYK